MRYFVRLSYHGKKFHGWQIQPNAISVQETLNEAFTRLTGEETYLVGAGRTDTGVHAREMWAHFDHAANLDHELVHKLNSYLGPDIAIYDLQKVREDAHARFDALSRSYIYQIITEKNPFLKDQAWHLYREPDMGKIEEATAVLHKHQDFSAFARSNTQTKTNLCRIDEARWECRGDLITFQITADRFLRNMVRAIVGTLVEIGMNKKEVADFNKIVESKDRRLAGESAPAHGLFLTKVKYPKDLFNGQ